MKIFLIEFTVLSVIMSLITCLLLAFSKKLKKSFSANCRYIIWLVVILRLCIPVGTFFSPSLINIPMSSTVIQFFDIDSKTESEGDKEIYVPHNSQNIEGIQGSEITENNDKLSYEQDGIPSDSAPVQNEQGGEDLQKEPFMFDKAMIPYIVFSVWVSGVAVFLIVTIVRHNLYVRKVKRSLCKVSDETEEIYKSLCKDMGVAHSPKLFGSKALQSPMLFGCFKPFIVVPEMDVSSAVLRRILMHELIHFRRADLFWLLASLFANALHWFNPIIYIACGRFNAEMELSCDEKTLEGADDTQRVIYGKAMLSIVSRCRGGGAVLTTRFDPKESRAGERIKSILDTKKKRRGIVLIVAIVVICLSAGILFGCANETPDKNATPSGDRIEEEKPEEKNENEETKKTEETTGADTHPEDTTATPSDTTVASEDTTARPVDTTAKPVDTTAKPVETTAKSVETTPPVQETPKVEKPSDELIKQIEEDYTELDSTYHKYDPEIHGEYYVRNYYGSYNGAAVCLMDGTKTLYLTVVKVETVAGSEFIYGNSNTIQVWKDGNFYSLEEAYQKGFLTKEEIAIIADIHNHGKYYRCSE